MARRLIPRKGNTQDNLTFTGVYGEIVIDMEKKEIILHDGIKEGGYRFPNLSSIVLDHNNLEGRNALAAHPANSIDWSAYNLTAQAIAEYVNSGGGGGGGTDRESTRLYLADYVTDPTSVASVDAGITELNSKMQDGMTVDLSGNYVWPEVSLKNTGRKGIYFVGGQFTRTSPGAGTEYLIWVDQSINTVVTGITLDGASPGTNFGSQGIYIRQSSNVVVHGNNFKDIGDGVIRYAHNPSTGDNTTSVTTDGVVISSNTFENCQQVTSNSTGAYNVVMVANVLKNSSIKVTQRTPQGDGWTIISKNVFKDRLGDAPVTMQGGANVIMDGNTIENCGGLFKFYPNNTPFGTENIPSSNIWITNNKSSNVEGQYTIYGEVRGGKAPNSILDLKGSLVIKGNTFTRKDGYNISLKPTIALFCYNPGAYFGDNIIIEDNTFLGDHSNLVQVGGDGYVTLKEGGLLHVRNNQGKSIFSALNLNIRPQVLGKGDVVIEENKINCPKFISLTFSNEKGSFKSYELRRNVVRVLNSGGIFTLQASLSSGINKTPVGLNTCAVDNEFIFEDATCEGFVFQLSTPNATDTSNFGLKLLNNSIIAANGSTVGLRALYVDVNNVGKAFSSVICEGNTIAGANVSNSLSDNVYISTESLLFIDNESPKVQLVYANDVTEANGFFRRIRTWSDGRHIQTGHAVLDFTPPASGNIYLGVDAPNEYYTVNITPTHPEPLLHCVKGKELSYFSPNFENLAGSQVLAEFDYTVEWFN